MILWAIIPVKPFRWGKSRLAPFMSTEERAALSFHLFSNALEQLSQVKLISRVIVISQDQEALDAARQLGAMPVHETADNGGLNPALEQATRLAVCQGAEAVLVIPADLPLLSARDVNEVIEQAGNPPEVIIVPDRREEGTNVMLINPAGMIDYQYGCDSFYRHRQQAEHKQIHMLIIPSKNLSIDMDVPEDFILARQMEPHLPVLDHLKHPLP